MTEKYETYAYFWVQGDFLISEITTILGVSPSVSNEKGDTMKYRIGKKWDCGNWQLHSPLSRNEIYQDSHISALLKILKPKTELIFKIQSLYETGINCVGYYTNTHPGFHIDKETIQNLATLNLSIDFDLYCLCDNHDKEY
jgi:hypothetical protein